MKKIIPNILVVLFLCVIVYIFLKDFKYDQMNFWMDSSGLFYSKNNIFKALYSWDNNIFGLYSYVVYSSLPYIFISGIAYNIFGLYTGTYAILVFTILLIIVSGYWVSSQVFNSRIKALVISPIFIFNPIVLFYFFGSGTFTFLLNFAGLLLTVFLISKFNHNKKDINLILMVFASILITHPFTFTFYYLYITYFFIFSHNLKKGIRTLINIFLINLFWICPFVASFFYKGFAILGTESSNSLIQAYSNLGNYSYSFLFLGRAFDILQTIFGEWYWVYVFGIFILWILLIYNVFFTKDKESKNIIVLYFIPVIVFLLFSFGPRGQLGIIYKFLHENIPIFILFRSYQNILIIVMTIFLFLLVVYAKKNKYTLIILQSISVLGVVFFITFGNSNIMGKSSNFPKDYFEVNNLVSKDKYQNKVLILPSSTYDYYTWDKENNDKYFLEHFFDDKGVIFYRPTINIQFLEQIFNDLYDGKLIEEDYNKFNIKYILVRKDLRFLDKGYYNKLPDNLNIPGKMVYSSSNIDLYKLENNAPVIQSSNLTFQRINPTKYELKIKSLKGPQKIAFLQSYNTGWNIFVNKFKETKCNNNEFYEKYNTKECESSNIVFQIKDMGILFDNNIFDDTHKVLSNYANEWTIDSEYIRKNFDTSYYKENPDGSVDVNITIFFKPQIYAMVAMAVSILIFLANIIYIGINLFKSHAKIKS